MDNNLRHPSQLYEAFLEGIVLFIIMNLLLFKKDYNKSFDFIRLPVLLYLLLIDLILDENFLQLAKRIFRF